MTTVEIDLAGADVYESVKVFLKYCPEGSPNEAIHTAMEYAKEKYPQMNEADYRRLDAIARQGYNDCTKSTRATLHQKSSLNRNNKTDFKNNFGKVTGNQG